MAWLIPYWFLLIIFVQRQSVVWPFNFVQPVNIYFNTKVWNFIPVSWDVFAFIISSAIYSNIQCRNLAIKLNDVMDFEYSLPQSSNMTLYFSTEAFINDQSIVVASLQFSHIFSIWTYRYMLPTTIYNTNWTWSQQLGQWSGGGVSQFSVMREPWRRLQYNCVCPITHLLDLKMWLKLNLKFTKLKDLHTPGKSTSQIRMHSKIWVRRYTRIPAARKYGIWGTFESNTHVQIK